MASTQTHAAQPAKTGGVKNRMLRDHRELEQLLTQVTSALEGGDPVDIAEVWTEFERRIRDHIDTEERCLFPRVPAAHWKEVEGLELEHERIRLALGELGNLGDLHALRKASVEELLVYLLLHAAAEERTLYPWVDDNATA